MSGGWVWGKPDDPGRLPVSCRERRGVAVDIETFQKITLYVGGAVLLFWAVKRHVRVIFIGLLLVIIAWACGWLSTPFSWPALVFLCLLWAAAEFRDLMVPDFGGSPYDRAGDERMEPAQEVLACPGCQTQNRLGDRQCRSCGRVLPSDRTAVWREGGSITCFPSARAQRFRLGEAFQRVDTVRTSWWDFWGRLRTGEVDEAWYQADATCVVRVAGKCERCGALYEEGFSARGLAEERASRWLPTGAANKLFGLVRKSRLEALRGARILARGLETHAKVPFCTGGLDPGALALIAVPGWILSDNLKFTRRNMSGAQSNTPGQCEICGWKQAWAKRIYQLEYAGARGGTAGNWGCGVAAATGVFLVAAALTGGFFRWQLCLGLFLIPSVVAILTFAHQWYTWDSNSEWKDKRLEASKSAAEQANVDVVEEWESVEAQLTGDKADAEASGEGRTLPVGDG